MIEGGPSEKDINFKLGQGMDTPEELSDPDYPLESGDDFETQQIKEIEIDKATMERTEKQKNFGELIEKFENDGDLTKEEVESLATKLEGRGWQKIYNNLTAGDNVAYLIVPGGELSIKNLNDKYLGPQETDEIIASRSEFIQNAMEETGMEFDMLSAKHNNNVIKVPESADAIKKLDGICKQVDEKMTGALLEKINNKIDELSPEEEKEKIQVFNDLKDNLEKHGFKVSFGLSKVKENDLENKTLAVTEAAQAAQIARRAEKDPTKDPEYGIEHSETKIRDEINRIVELADKIEESNILIDKNGIEYQIFSATKDETEKEKKIINRDLVRAIRKNKFIPAAGEDNEKTLKQIEQYTRRINLLDILKPITTNDIRGENKNELQNQIKENIALAAAMRNGESITDDERKKIAEILSSDEKDPNYTSAEVFHHKATKQDELTYISIDVLDLGVDLLLGYESLLQDINSREITLEEASIIAGDEITERMRTVRRKASDIAKKHSENGKDPLVLVGGDEMTIALNENNNIDELLLELRRETGSRVIKTVIKTVVASSEKKVENHPEENPEQKLKEHLIALRKAEDGATAAKEIEEAMREFELLVITNEQKRGKNKQDAETTASTEILSMGLNNFVIKENVDGGFIVVIPSDEGNTGYKSMRWEKVLSSINDKLEEYQKPEEKESEVTNDLNS